MKNLARAGVLTGAALAAIVAFMAASFEPSLLATALAQTLGTPVTTPSGLQIIDTKIGTGAVAEPGQTCVMHYTGWLYEDGKKGKKFDSLGRSQRAVRISDRHNA